MALTPERYYVGCGSYTYTRLGVFPGYVYYMHQWHTTAHMGVDKEQYIKNCKFNNEYTYF